MSRIIAAAIGLTLLLSGCQQVTPQVTEPDIDTVKAAVQQILPKCKFEQVEAPNGDIRWDEQGPRDTDRILARGELWRFSVFPEYTGQADYESVGYSFNSNPEVDRVWLCNSVGRSITKVKEYGDVVGPEECSDMQGQVRDEPSLLAKCIKQLEKNLKLGYWVVIRESENPEQLRTELIEIAGTNLENPYNQNTRPVLLGNGLAVTMDGPFEYVPLTKIKNIDWVWKKLRNTTGLQPIGKYVPGYPKSFIFEGDKVGVITIPTGGSRDGLLDTCFDYAPNSFWTDEGLCNKLSDEMKK